MSTYMYTYMWIDIHIYTAQVLLHQHESVSSVSWSPDSRAMVVCSSDGIVWAWDVVKVHTYIHWYIHWYIHTLVVCSSDTYMHAYIHTYKCTYTHACMYMP